MTGRNTVGSIYNKSRETNIAIQVFSNIFINISIKQTWLSKMLDIYSTYLIFRGSKDATYLNYWKVNNLFKLKI